MQHTSFDAGVYNTWTLDSQLFYLQSDKKSPNRDLCRLCLQRLKHERCSPFRAGCYSINKRPHRKDPIGTVLVAYTLLFKDFVDQ